MNHPTLSRIVLLCFACFFIINLSAQVGQSAEKWREDLRFLQQTVHDDYPFLFKKSTPEAFDELVEQLYAEIPEMEEHQIVAGFSRIVASFKYGHTALAVQNSKLKFHQLPFNLYQFSDGIYLQAVRKADEASLGAKVLAIEGMPIEQALEAIKPVVPAENEQYFKAYGINFVRIPEVLHAQGVMDKLKKEVTLTLEKDGQSFEHTFTAEADMQVPAHYSLVPTHDDWLDARNADNTPLYLKNLDRICHFEYLPEEKAVYVRQSQVQDDEEETIAEFYERVFKFVDENEVDRLIIDVRLNGGGNNYKNKPVVTGLIKAEQVNRPGHLFVIIGRRTFSACQNLVNEMDNYTNAIFVGEPTAENINFYGDNREVKLPNSQIPVYLSFAWWQDKPQWENEDWLAPHIPVEMSFEQYKKGKDPVLKAALEFDNDNYIPDPVAYLEGLYVQKKYDQLKEEAARMVADPRYSAVNFEQKFNETGYSLMKRDQVEAAMFVFQLNTELFPDSANTWDSLGESCLKAKQVNKAKEYYQKAIKLDPDGWVGENARAMLKKIETGN